MTKRTPPADPLAFTPVPRQRMRRGGWSAARQRAFIDALVETGSVRAACRQLGVGEHHIYKLRGHPEGASFRAAWEAALDMGIQRIEDVAMDRALHGVKAPVFYHGEQIGTRQVYNDRLLMFLLSNRRPARFAHGNARSLGAISPAQLTRLKAQWQKEYEATLRKVTPEQVRASIDRKIEEIRRRIEKEKAAQWAKLSEETREAWAQFIALRDRDLAAMNADANTRDILSPPWNAPSDRFDPPEPPPPPSPSARKSDDGSNEDWQRPPPGWGAKEPPPPPKTEWTVKDPNFDP